MSRSFLNYYETELKFLIEEGRDFSKQNPNIGSSLDWTNSGSNDPDVKKLIESIAFLNAKLQKKLDENTQIISEKLLEEIYPQFQSIIPSCAIMQFSSKIAGKFIPKNTQILFENYIFETIHDIQISDWSIKNIELTNSYALPENIYKKTNNAVEILLNPLNKNPENSLKFYINMMENDSLALYSMLMSFYENEPTPIFENKEQIGEILPLGFKHNLLPKTNNTTYDEIIEFNSFKEKFLFFEIKLFKLPKEKIQIPIKSNSIFLKNDSLLLNCIPCVNLFKKISEPISVDNTEYEYPINPTNNNYDNLIIHSILEVKDTNKNQYAPYYSCQHDSQKTLWIINTKKNEITQKNEKFISLVNNSIEERILYANLLCCQKDTSKINENTKWIVDKIGNVECINITKPTAASDFSKDNWKLVSHLAINYFGLDSKKALQYIKELFKIYSTDSTLLMELFEIKNIHFQTKMIPFKKTMVPETNITMEVGESETVFLLAEIIGQFLAKKTNLNTKFKFKLKKGKSLWKTWQI